MSPLFLKSLRILFGGNVWQLDSALRLELQPANWCSGRSEYTVETLAGDRALIRPADNSGLREVLVGELRGLPSLTTVELGHRVERFRTINSAEWNKAQRRQAVIREVLQDDGPVTTLVDIAVDTLDLSTVSVPRQERRQVDPDAAYGCDDFLCRT